MHFSSGLCSKSRVHLIASRWSFTKAPPQPCPCPIQSKSFLIFLLFVELIFLSFLSLSILLPLSFPSFLFLFLSTVFNLFFVFHCFVQTIDIPIILNFIFQDHYQFPRSDTPLFDVKEIDVQTTVCEAINDKLGSSVTYLGPAPKSYSLAFPVSGTC